MKINVNQEGIEVEPGEAIVIFRPCAIIRHSEYTVAAICEETFSLSEFLISVMHVKAKRGAGGMVYVKEGELLARVMEGKAFITRRLVREIVSGGFALAVAEGRGFDSFTRCPRFTGFYVLVLPRLVEDAT